MSYARKTAKILLETQAIVCRPHDPFTLTSGEKSPVYVDCRKLIAFPKARKSLMKMAKKYLRKQLSDVTFDGVAGGETAGIAYAAWIGAGLDLPMSYIRKKPKTFGKKSRIEGLIRPHENILLVEDLATDGGSKLSFVEAIKQAGAQCHHCFVIFNYDIFPDGKALLDKAGLTLHSLATWADVIAYIREHKALPPEQIVMLESFLANPTQWRKDHAS